MKQVKIPTIQNMKLIKYSVLSILLSTGLLAKPNVMWDDPNPSTANVVSYIVYEKIITGTVVTWKPIWKVVASKVFDLPARNVTTTYAVTAVNNLSVESKRSNELVVMAPEALQNLRIQTP